MLYADVARARAAAWLVALVVGCGANGPDDDGAGEGSGSGSGDSTGEPPAASLLELCDAPAPCDAFSIDPGSNPDAPHPALECALAQAVGSLSDGRIVELTSSFCDIGCSGTDLLLVGDGTVFVQSWSQTDTTSFATIDRCTLPSASFFDACVGQPWSTGGCSSWAQWGTDCAPVDVVQCP